MMLLARRRRRVFDIRSGLGFLGEGETASVTPSSFGESAAPIGPVSVTPTGFGEASEPSISAAALSPVIPVASVSVESAALFPPAALTPQTAPPLVSDAQAAAAIIAQLQAAKDAMDTATIAYNKAYDIVHNNAGVPNYRSFNPIKSDAAYLAMGLPTYLLPQYAGGGVVHGPSSGDLQVINAGNAALAARDNYLSSVRNAPPAARVEMLGSGINFLYGGPATAAGAGLRSELQTQYDANVARIPNLISPDFFAQQIYNESYAAANQGYTEGSNITQIQYAIADRFYNQPALVAARGGKQINVTNTPEAQAAIAQGQYQADQRHNATKDDWLQEIFGDAPRDFSSFYHEMPALAQVAFNYASSGIFGYVSTGIDVLSSNSYQYHKDINSTNIVNTVVPTQINSGNIISAAASIAAQNDSGGESGGSMDSGGDSGSSSGGDMEVSSADSSFSSDTSFNSQPIDFSFNSSVDFAPIDIPAPDITQDFTAPSSDISAPASSPESAQLFAAEDLTAPAGDLAPINDLGDFSSPPMPPAILGDNPYGETMPPAIENSGMPPAIPETAESLKAMGMKEVEPGVWTRDYSGSSSFDTSLLEKLLYKTADGLLMHYVLSLASNGSNIFAPTTVNGSAPAGSSITNLPPHTTLAPIPVSARGPQSQLIVQVRGGAGFVKEAGLQISKIANTLSGSPLPALALAGALYLGMRRTRSNRRTA